MMICSLLNAYRLIETLALSLAAVFILFDTAFPFRPEIEYSRVVLSSNGSVIGAALSSDDKWRFKSETGDIEPQLIKLLIEKEDKYFFVHPGVNPAAVLRAAWSNMISGEIVSGASTLSMQLARMFEPKERTYPNKLFEIFRAIQLEWYLSKNEILELYLNKLPFGGNIEGVSAASVLYLDKNPISLSLAECAALASIPNNPNGLLPGKFNVKIIEKRNLLLQKLKESGIFSESELDFAKSEPFDAQRREIPKIAPHLTFRLISQTNALMIKTEIDLDLQKKTQSIIQSYMINQKSFGINNSAVIIVDNKTSNVIAYHGSNDFFDDEHNGQVDGITAIRSPGSALKPFVYGLGFELGLITPMYKLPDVPQSFSDYSPENFDGKYNGMVTARESLVRSLNVPPVLLADKTGLVPLIKKLKACGFEHIDETREKLGLSLVLGGCGVTLEELALAYSTLARSGIKRNLRYITGAAQMKPDTALSEEAAFLVNDILSSAPLPDIKLGGESVSGLPEIAFKTGTSYGRHDAWCIGYDENFTVAVWTGNFSGEANTALTGASTATPLMLLLFRELDTDFSGFQKPEGIELREVDVETGQIPGEFTQSTIPDYYIHGVSQTGISDYFRQVPVNSELTISYCNSCLPESGYSEELFPNLIPELAAYFNENNIPYKKIPPHNSKCSGILSKPAPVIEFPVAGQEYIVQSGIGNKIALRAKPGNSGEIVYWYLNSKFFRKAGKGETEFFAPEKPGNYKIECSDEFGNKSEVRIKVSFY